jgi:hypothetical protein
MPISLMPAPMPRIRPAAFRSSSARDQQQVDPVEAEAHQAVLAGPHDPVMAVIEAQGEIQAAGPRTPIDSRRIVRCP